MGKRGIAAVLAAGCAAGALGGAALAGHRDTYTALFGVLQGRNEIDAEGRRGAGDPNGRGGATAVIDGNTLCFGLTVRNIDTPTGAHIHIGRRNRNGPVVVPLVAPTAGDPGASSGCVDVSSDVARALRRRPGRHYWNVHTEAYPGGAIRGQLTRDTRR